MADSAKRNQKVPIIEEMLKLSELMTTAINCVKILLRIKFFCN